MDSVRKIAVIVPYFQVEQGILRRALQSIRQQNLPHDVAVDVLVIDDASPHPAELEMAGLISDARVRFYAYTQKNGGPGSARNNALNRVHEDGGYSFVAFLDSDDEWMPNHIKDAVGALDQGYDFYFCDNERDGAFESYNTEVEYLANKGALLRAKPECIQMNEGVLGFPAFALKNEMIETCLSHTSCVVLRADRVANLRFDDELRSAGEDHMFWITVVLSGARTAISWALNVKCGRGVNIFFSSFDWNKRETLDRVCNLALFGSKLSRLPDIGSANVAVAIRTRNKYRRAYAYLISRAILKRQAFRSNAFNRLCRYDPIFPLRIPFLTFLMLNDKSPDARKF